MARTGRPPAPPKTKLGSLMRARRAESGDAAAVLLGVDRGTYYRIERGAYLPSIATAAKLAAWLGLTVGQVIDAAREPVGEGG